LKEIQSALGGVGGIHKHGKNSIQLRVESIKELQKVVDHFDKYPLVSGKAVDYFLFKECFNIIKQQEHLTHGGLLKLIAIKASLNLGLPLNLKEAFPNVEGHSRPDYTFKGIVDPN